MAALMAKLIAVVYFSCIHMYVCLVLFVVVVLVILLFYEEISRRDQILFMLPYLSQIGKEWRITYTRTHTQAKKSTHESKNPTVFSGMCLHGAVNFISQIQFY